MNHDSAVEHLHRCGYRPRINEFLPFAPVEVTDETNCLVGYFTSMTEAARWLRPTPIPPQADSSWVGEGAVCENCGDPDVGLCVTCAIQAAIEYGDC